MFQIEQQDYCPDISNKRLDVAKKTTIATPNVLVLMLFLTLLLFYQLEVSELSPETKHYPQRL